METVTEEEVRDVMDELPLEKLSAAAMKGKTVADYLVALRCAESKKAAKRLVQGGGVKLNGRTITQPNYVVMDSDLVDSCLLPVCVGKKTRKFALVK